MVTIGDSFSNHPSFVYLSDCLCLCIFYEAWDDILSLSESVGESAMDSATGFAGAITVFYLYWPFIFKLRQFGKGIVKAQENFNYCAKKPKKNYGKISLCTEMYDLY